MGQGVAVGKERLSGIQIPQIDEAVAASRH